MSGVVPLVMLPGSGPACEGDDCLPAVPAEQARPDGAASA